MKIHEPSIGKKEPTEKNTRDEFFVVPNTSLPWSMCVKCVSRWQITQVNAKEKKSEEQQTNLTKQEASLLSRTQTAISAFVFPSVKAGAHTFHTPHATLGDKILW